MNNLHDLENAKKLPSQGEEELEMFLRKPRRIGVDPELLSWEVWTNELIKWSEQRYKYSMPEKQQIEQSKLLSTYNKYLALFLKELNDKGQLGDPSLSAAPPSNKNQKLKPSQSNSYIDLKKEAEHTSNYEKPINLSAQLNKPAGLITHPSTGITSQPQPISNFKFGGHGLINPSVQPEKPSQNIDSDEQNDGSVRNENMEIDDPIAAYPCHLNHPIGTSKQPEPTIDRKRTHDQMEIINSVVDE